MAVFYKFLISIVIIIRFTFLSVFESLWEFIKKSDSRKKV